ncbi:beta-ketoacyl-[acyl-carrier-protein] synthase family protein [Massilia sp. CCM 8693]|uniref:Beta-ketoacyl-[acyl-carrier-protein] synthase family protein n=1 Tax=Massilia aquatica TaxID=2609000 RepID=A0ABX0LWK8_9BURK|nr:beta-ketoacyl-[acyl-carrier-protein] synthase family protein [Massilia aquatica]NHZ39238.1 beta-ketoacyl-[acyl-carrier-protein] synthase family protein [Massilia aquatica]
MKRAVITGVGAVSAFGVGVPALFDGLAGGRSRIAPVRSFDASAFDTRVACEVAGAGIGRDWLRAHLGSPGHAEAVLDEYERAGAWRDRKCMFALLAAVEAWRMAGCGQGDDEAALVMALGLEQAFLDDFGPMFSGQAIDWAAGGHEGIRLRSDVDLGARLVGDVFGLHGQMIVNASACAAGGLAIAHAASLIERGAASIVLCGGADSMVNPFGLGGMSRLGAPSPRNEPDACRPFDLRRDGLVIGEGAAMFVIESEQRAARRGARVLARVLGYGSTQDAYRVTAPRPDGAAAKRAMELALLRARLAPAGVGYLNAHGTGTPLNDVAEARAIAAVFGAGAVPVSSVKGAIGHLMAASGAIEAAACLLAFERNLLPGTANHRDPDPQCEVDVIKAPRAAKVDAVLSNSFGFGGQNVSLILGRSA